MITLKEKVRKDTKNFELKLIRAKKYADKQEFEKKVLLYKKINTIEYDLIALKETLDPKITPADKSRFYLKSETKSHYEKIINGFKDLDDHMKITIWRDDPSFIEAIADTYKKLKNKFLSTASA